MEYCITAAAAYLIHFYPEFFSRSYVVITLLSLQALIFTFRKRDSLLILLVALLFLQITESLAVSVFDTAIEHERVAMIHGRVIQDSQMRSGRKAGFRIQAYYSADGSADLYSAVGNVFVISPSSDFYYGDEVSVWGSFSGPVFYSYSSRLDSRPCLSEIRVKLISEVKGMFTLFGEAGELASLLILGTGSDGDYILTDDARTSGLSHVLALSGMHLSIIAFLFAKPLEQCIGKKWGKAVLTAILFLFCFLSGWRPSLMRAFIFRSLFLLKVEAREAFMLSMVVLYLLFPYSTSDIGGLLSFISLSGILLLSERIAKGLRCFIPLPYAFLLSVGASAAALLFSVPFSLSLFGGYQMWAVVTSYPFNLLISVYMVMALFALLIPQLGYLLVILHSFLEQAFAITGRSELSTGMGEYLILALSIASLLIISYRVDAR